MKNFKDVTALISGASSGIGLGIAKALVADGAKVAITGTNPTKLAAAKAELEALGGKVLTLQFDVADLAAWRDAAAKTETELGPIGFLCLNAGIATLGTLIENTTDTEWRASWDVNFMGVVNGMRACLPAMRAHGQPGHVTVTSSLGGVMPFPTTGPYCTMKSAVISLVEVLKQELAGSEITASVGCPGQVATDLPASSNRHVAGVFPEYLIPIMEANLASALDPDDVGRFTLDRIRDGHFYIFSHNEGHDAAKARYEGTTAAMAYGAKSALNTDLTGNG